MRPTAQSLENRCRPLAHLFFCNPRSADAKRNIWVRKGHSCAATQGSLIQIHVSTRACFQGGPSSVVGGSVQLCACCPISLPPPNLSHTHTHTHTHTSQIRACLQLRGPCTAGDPFMTLCIEACRCHHLFMPHYGWHESTAPARQVDTAPLILHSSTQTHVSSDQGFRCSTSVHGPHPQKESGLSTAQSPKRFLPLRGAGHHVKPLCEF